MYAHWVFLSAEVEAAEIGAKLTAGLFRESAVDLVVISSRRGRKLGGMFR